MEITVGTTINLPVGKVWEYWTKPEHITGWNFASGDWWSPRAENDIRPGGKLSWRMEARDGSMGFDFSGKYLKVEHFSELEYVLDDGRNVKILFTDAGGKTIMTETFEAEGINSIELQREGWQNILNNFKKYSELKG